MARKPRDYKAEYAAAKRRATVSGFKSERQYKAARKKYQLPRGAQPLNPVSLQRRANQKWSDQHSHVPNSKYSRHLSDDESEKYFRSYVEKVGEKSARGKREKLKRLHDYLVPDHMDEVEWEGKYLGED